MTCHQGDRLDHRGHPRTPTDCPSDVPDSLHSDGRDTHAGAHQNASVRLLAEMQVPDEDSQIAASAVAICTYTDLRVAANLRHGFRILASFPY